MTVQTKSKPIAYFVYGEGGYPASALDAAVHDLRKRGFRVDGLLQRELPRPGRSRCDMLLEHIATGTRVPISEDRGQSARACQLDPAGLAQAHALLQQSMSGETDIVIISKFGKAEAEGGGLRGLIEAALAQGSRLVIGVPERNLEHWQDFADDFGERIAVGDLALHFCAQPAAE